MVMLGPMEGPLQPLTHEECVARLRSGSIGRIAITHQALPVVVPVNYALDGSVIVFRTETGGMLARACTGSVVAFEVDDLDHSGRGGWSVLVVGVADLLRGSAEVRATETGLVTAAGAHRDQFVGITVGQITGRFVHVAPVPAGPGQR